MSLSTLMLRNCSKAKNALLVVKPVPKAFAAPKHFSHISWQLRTAQVCQLSKLNRDFLVSNACFVQQFSSKPDSSGPSLADQILQSKKSEQKEENKEEAKGPKPMTKWQKYGYVFFGVTFVGMFITNAVLFCKMQYLNGLIKNL